MCHLCEKGQVNIAEASIKAGSELQIFLFGNRVEVLYSIKKTYINILFDKIKTKY